MEWIAKMSFLLFSFLLLLLVEGRSSSAIKDLSVITFRLQSCGAVGSTPPKECKDFYRRRGSPVADHLRQSNVPGAQLFRIPRSGLYNVTVAGASGGDGACHPSGWGHALRATFGFTEGQELMVFVGQQGLAGCKNASGAYIPFCQRWTNSTNITTCTRQWFQDFSDRPKVVFNNEDLVLYEGGGGGGGASLVQFVGANQPLMVAGGGGGGGAAYNQTVLADYLQSNPGFQSNAYPPPADPNNQTGLSGWSFEQTFASAGVGGGYKADSRATDRTDGGSLSSNRGPAGGADCLGVDTQPTPLLHSRGGFGGGGGGCENGGGGGGYTGGRVSNYESDDSSYLSGEGGRSYITTNAAGTVHPYTDLGLNKGDGYVELLPLNCFCTGECLIVDDTFCCSCPDNTVLAPDGFDCYKDVAVTLDKADMVATDYGSLVHHAISPVASLDKNDTSAGEQSGASSQELSVLSVYSVMAVMSVDPAGGSGSSSSGCALLLVDKDGQITATSEWIPVSGSSSSYNKMIYTLLLVEQAGNSSLLVSSNASRYLDTPVDAVFLTVLSVGLHCRLTSARLDASIMVNDAANVSTQLSPPGVEALIQMLAPPPTAVQPAGLNDGAIAGVVIACVLALLLLIATVVAAILFARHCKRLKHVGLLEKRQRGSVASDYHNSGALTLFKNPLHRRHTYTTIPVLDLKFGVAAPEGTDFTAFNLARVTANLKEWEYPRENLIYLRELGQGQYGKVHLMKAKDICGYEGMLPVAVKTLSSLKKDEMEKFYEEIEMMRTFTHPNIVSLLGMCSEVEDGPPMLILELMEYGDLKSFLIDNEPKEGEMPRLGLPQFYSFAADVANALVFLMSKQYIHRDIAARNCLVGKGLLVKLSDFGLARGLQDQEYYRLARATMLPLRWMAPECIFYGTFVQESDVWSFGVLLWEIMTYCDQPYGELESNELLDRIEKNSLFLPCPPSCPPEYFAKIQQCQEYDPTQRPSITDLHQFFTSKANELKETIDECTV